MIRSYPRTTVAALVLSAAGFAGLAINEGYTDRAIIPVPGDVPTVGLGSTIKEDGSRVQMGDTITPPKAIRLAVSHIAKGADNADDQRIGSRRHGRGKRIAIGGEDNLDHAQCGNGVERPHAERFLEDVFPVR